jgi:predicted permease
MAIAKRRMLFAAVLGLLVAVGLNLVQTSLSDSPNMNVAREVASIMMMPALLITTTTRQIHSKSTITITLLDFAFYTICFYGLFSITAGRKQKP